MLALHSASLALTTASTAITTPIMPRVAGPMMMAARKPVKKKPPARKPVKKAVKAAPKRAPIRRSGGGAEVRSSPILRVHPNLAMPSAELALVSTCAQTLSDLAALEVDAGIPAIGFWDPLGFTKLQLFEFDQPAVIDWLRHAELKHGRVAMAGFVGFCVQANGLYWPWAATGGKLADSSTMFADISAAGGPCDRTRAVTEHPRPCTLD